jgi:hypothetical protein
LASAKESYTTIENSDLKIANKGGYIVEATLTMSDLKGSGKLVTLIKTTTLT